LAVTHYKLKASRNGLLGNENLDIASINAELASLLDVTNKDCKKFISDFLDKLENLSKITKPK
jgi:hypothetical protein